jgi:hypothetical protein
VRLTRPIDNIGPSLEHYVAVLCEHELRASAGWGVKLEGIIPGGDYDVLAWLSPLLMYVECKTGAPDAIEDKSLRHFLQRTHILAPDLAVLLIDSDQPLDDFVSRRIDPIIHKAVDSLDPEWRAITAQPEFPGILWGHQRIYVTNSEPSIITQLRRCLQHYYVYVRGTAFFDGDMRLNYL